MPDISCYVVDGKDRPLMNHHGHRIVVRVPVDQAELDRITIRHPLPQLRLTDKDGEVGLFHLTSLREVKK